MNVKRVFVNAAASALVAGAGIFAIATPAQAAPPSCIYFRNGSSPTAGSIYNTCSSSQRVKVVWSYAPDSRCYTVAAGGRQAVGSQYPTAQFDKLASC